MPVYEYRCGGCGHRFEKLIRSVAAAGPAVCPQCQSSGAQREMSRFAYHRSLQMQIEQIDPQIDKELDWADSLNPEPATSRINVDFDRELPPSA